jgi:uncharacterized membrane protein YccC
MAPVEWARGILRTIVAFDRSTLEYGFAIRCSIGVAIPLVIACALGHPAAGFAPAIGALIGGFTSQQGIYRSRIAVVLGVTLGIALSSFLGAIAAPSLPALILLTAAVGYFYGTVSQFGLPAGVVALNTAVAFILFSSLPLDLGHDFEQSSLLFAGGMIQAVLLIIVWPLDSTAIERRGLAAAYRELGAYSRSVASTDAKLPPIAALATARQIVADQQPLARSSQVARFKRMLSEGEALRHRLGALTTLQFADSGDRLALAGLATALATQLDALAATLEGTMTRDELESIRTQTSGAFDVFEAACAQKPFALALVRDIATHLRDATQAVAVAATGKPVRLLFSAAPRPSAYIQTKIDWLSRDAIRIAVILSIAMLLGHTLFAGSRGYWIALTAALVLKPDLQTTVVRGFARIAGTLLGAVIAVGAVTLSQGDSVWQSAVIIAAALVCYLTIVPNYALFSTAMTVFVLVALDLRGLTGHMTVENRVLDTLVGGTLAMVGYVAFPSWARRRTRPLLADTVDAQRAFAVALLDAYADPDRCDREDIGTLRTRAWKIRTEVEASIDAARAEPRRPHTIGVSRALSVLAAIQSFSLSSMALEAGIETMPPPPPLPALAAFRDALDRAMRDISAALLEDRAAAPDDTLERTFLALSNVPEITEHTTYRFVVDYSGGYVQSVAALAQLTGGEPNP